MSCPCIVRLLTCKEGFVGKNLKRDDSPYYTHGRMVYLCFTCAVLD